MKFSLIFFCNRGDLVLEATEASWVSSEGVALRYHKTLYCLYTI